MRDEIGFSLSLLMGFWLLLAAIAITRPIVIVKIMILASSLMQKILNNGYISQELVAFIKQDPEEYEHRFAHHLHIIRISGIASLLVFLILLRYIVIP